MAKRKRLTGKERREARRRQRERVRSMPRDVALVAAVISIPVIIALVLILFVIDGGGDDKAVVIASPTPLDATPPSFTPPSFTPLPVTPGPDSPPPLEIEPEITGSGLGIITIEEGEGEGALPGQTLSVNYTGWLTADGSKFDSSLDRGEPFQFILGRGNVIAGWDEGLTGASPGTKLRLLIPSDLAYGEQGQGANIPPNSDLTFDVEVLEILPTDDSGG